MVWMGLLEWAAILATTYASEIYNPAARFGVWLTGLYRA